MNLRYLAAPVLIGLIALIPLGALATPDKKKKLRSKEIKALQKKANRAAGEERWDDVADAILELAPANKKKVYQFISKLARRAPERSRVAMALVKAAEQMDHRSVKREILKDLEGHRSKAVRRGLVGAFAKRKDWDVVIKALEDKDEEVAYVAAWQLTEHKVERGVLPMIKAMEALDKTQEGVWYELRHLLGKLLGKKLNNGAEYRSWWTQLKEKGGLKGVAPPKAGAAPDPNEGGSTALRFFGRSIDSNRVVFILDVSGSMDKVDRPPIGRAGGGLRGSSSSRKPRKLPPPRKDLKNRLQRAQHQLKRVLERLSNRTRVNIIAYSGKNKILIWKDKQRGGVPPTVHPLNKDNRKSAIAFVDSFRAQGATATDLALVKAYTVEGARCFYLLSDGAPTHGGGKMIPTEEILDIVRNNDNGRHIRINTLGFKGAKKEMMQRLAAGTGGSYSDIPPQ